MKEHPILFSGEMVKAILEGRKTQTRRVLSPQNSYPGSGTWKTHLYDFDRARIDGPNGLDATGNEYLHVAFCNKHDGWEDEPQDDTVDRVRCKWKAGDRLWVKEALKSWCYSPVTYGTRYEATPDDLVIHPATEKEYRWRWVKDVLPSIFMPRWASRITLEIVSVRVQRLQNISEKDAEAEGFYQDYCGGGWRGDSARSKFHKLWDSINGKEHPWSSNPWVWAIEFRRVAQ